MSHCQLATRYRLAAITLLGAFLMGPGVEAAAPPSGGQRAGGNKKVGLEIQNAINHSDKWAYIELWVNGRSRGGWWQHSGSLPGNWPYPTAKRGKRIKWKVTWNGQSRQVSFTANSKPERVRYTVRNGNLKLRRV